MQITLDFRKKRPISDQIQDELRERILSGLLPPGEQLPAVRELASMLDINFNTVARAYRQLDQEGWISTQQGRGTYVLSQALSSEKTRSKFEEQQLEVLLDSFFRKAQDLQIPVDQIKEAFTHRIGQLIQRQHPRVRRGPKRISRKPYHLTANPDSSKGMNSSKKISKRRKTTAHVVSRETTSTD